MQDYGDQLLLSHIIQLNKISVVVIYVVNIFLMSISEQYHPAIKIPIQYVVRCSPT